MTACHFEACEDPAVGRDLCALHYRNWRRTVGVPVPAIVRANPDHQPPAAPDGPHVPLYVGSTKSANGLLVAYALVDEEEVERLGRYRWTVNSNGYAVRSVKQKPREVAMHRDILGLGGGNPRQGDHIDRNRLNNRRSNLRIVPAHHQAQNMSPHRDGSGRRGASFHKVTGKWQAYTNVAGRRVHLGLFPTQEEAAEIARVARRSAMPAAVD